MTAKFTHNSDRALTWSDPYPTKQKGKRKPIDVKTALGDVPESRFHLYQTADMAKRVKTMWVLYDQVTETQHFLYGQGWDEAQFAAKNRIIQTLEKE